MDYVLLRQKIRAARISAGLSQERLAEMVGLTSQHISHTEVASTKISLPSLIKISNALHTRVDRLLSDSIHDSKAYRWMMYRLSFLAAIPTRYMSCWKPQTLPKKQYVSAN